MNAIELVEKAKKKFDATVQMIDVAAELIDGDGFWFADKDYVTCHPMTYDEIIETITKARRNGAKFELNSYHIGNYSVGLSMSYGATTAKGLDANIIFYASDYINALEKISNGKCRIEERQSVPEKVVVCDAEA